MNSGHLKKNESKKGELAREKTINKPLRGSEMLEAFNKIKRFVSGIEVFDEIFNEKPLFWSDIIGEFD